MQFNNSLVNSPFQAALLPLVRSIFNSIYVLLNIYLYGVFLFIKSCENYDID